MSNFIRQRPSRPLDAFPRQEWRRWREHVLTVDIEAIHAAVIAERLDAVLQQSRAAGTSLRNLATRAGLSRTTVSNVARCLTYPMEGMIARLQDELAIDLSPNAEVRAVKTIAWRDRCARVETERDELQRRFDQLEAQFDQVTRERRPVERTAGLSERTAQTAI